MTDDLRPPYRIAFDNARDPYTARNALGITSTGGGPPAPIDAQYITAAADATLTNERVLTNTATVTWDFATAGQAKANATGFGNVSNSGTPVAGQVAEWVTTTTIQGVSTYAKLASPALTGTPTAPTAAAGTNSTQIATTAFVQNEYATRSLFRVTMSANQTAFSAGTYFQVLFNTAGQNIGGHYNTGTQRWTPPPGRVMLMCNLWSSNGTAATAILADVRKNGTALHTAVQTISATGNTGISFSTMDVANGTDYYEIFFQFTGVGGGGGNVVAANSWFAGALL